MSTARRVMIGGLGLAIALSLFGCQAQEREIQGLQLRVEDLQRENTDLRSRLARAISDRDAARARALALQQQVEELMQELADARGARRELPEGWELGAGGMIFKDIGTEFLFDEGYANLRPDGKATLQQVVNDIQTNFTDDLIWVVGHTDNKPLDTKKHLYKDNLGLSLARGATVYRELMKIGISPQRMIAGGHGEYEPKVPNTSEANKQINRRVQIIASPMQGPAGEGPARTVQPSPVRKTEPGDLIQK